MVNYLDTYLAENPTAPTTEEDILLAERKKELVGRVRRIMEDPRKTKTKSGITTKTRYTSLLRRPRLTTEEYSYRETEPFLYNGLPVVLTNRRGLLQAMSLDDDVVVTFNGQPVICFWSESILLPNLDRLTADKIDEVEELVTLIETSVPTIESKS